MGQVLFDLWGIHGRRVSFVVEQDESLDPADIGLFCCTGVLLQADGSSDAFQQLSFGRFGGVHVFFFSVVWFLSEFFVLCMGLSNRCASWGAVDILNFFPISHDIDGYRELVQDIA